MYHYLRSRHPEYLSKQHYVQSAVEHPLEMWSIYSVIISDVGHTVLNARTAEVLFTLIWDRHSCLLRLHGSSCCHGSLGPTEHDQLGTENVVLELSLLFALHPALLIGGAARFPDIALVTGT